MRQAQYSARTLSMRIMRGGLAAPEITAPLAEGFSDAVHPIPVKSEGVSGARSLSELEKIKYTLNSGSCETAGGIGAPKIAAALREGFSDAEHPHVPSQH
jgi:hypothetical protein